MGTKDQNLSSYQLEKKDLSEIKIGIVVSDWNQDITSALKKGCEDTLQNEGIRKENIFQLHVPGSFELPAGCRILDDRHNLDAVIALGCVIKGDTNHDEYINQAVANGLMQLGLLRAKPFVFGLVTTNDKAQAKARSGGKMGNKGIEAAVTAIKMAALKKDLKSTSKRIGFS
ncbi:MAG: 6,7-dimethyl-8-ribityllumazine synthase [Saprospiraceae bacterium]|nr:6,7-dimethyl-8-ribityllumazine synthase [Saprospiraceae bacterium]